MVERRITVSNPKGIHARPAAHTARTAARFSSRIEIIKNGQTVDARSVIMILQLCTPYGEELTVRADGPDEAEAIEAVVQALESRFEDG